MIVFICPVCKCEKYKSLNVLLMTDENTEKVKEGSVIPFPEGVFTLRQCRNCSNIFG